MLLLFFPSANIEFARNFHVGHPNGRSNRQISLRKIFGVRSPKPGITGTYIHLFLNCQVPDLEVSQYWFFSFIQRGLNPEHLVECPNVQAGLVKSLPSKGLPANCHERSTKPPGICHLSLMAEYNRSCSTSDG